MCREHAEYALSYLEVMLEEYQYRRSRPHVLSKFGEWARSSNLPFVLPESGLSKVTLPWKSLKTRFRRRDVIEGYRL